MSTYSASKAVAIPQTAEEGAVLAGRPLSLPASLLASGTAVLASVAWVGFGLSCLWWADLADWPQTAARAPCGARARAGAARARGTGDGRDRVAPRTARAEVDRLRRWRQP